MLVDTNNPYLGIDGCKGGWFCVEIGETGDWGFSVVQAGGLDQIVARASLALIDIPIGLVGSGVGARQCDREARGMLGKKRGSSVFSPPARGTLTAHDFSESVEINRQITGKGISKQSWAIAPKIRLVDELLRSRPELRGVLRECHPEVCFWALNGGESMKHRKKSRSGRDERMKVLLPWFPAAERLYEKASATYRRSQLAADDIVDAMVAAVTAHIGAGRLKTLPAQPPRDDEGLNMEMVYFIP